jgi:hypothetical protein
MWKLSTLSVNFYSPTMEQNTRWYCPYPEDSEKGADFGLLLDLRQGAEFEYLSTFGIKIFSTFFNLPIDKSPKM